MRLALITGGSRGLGHALSESLTEQGYRVMEFSRGAAADYSFPVDLGDPGQALQDIRRALSGIEPQSLTDLVVVSNAGTLAPIGPAWRKPAAEVLNNINVNFTAPILCISELVACFRDAPARKLLVNVSSGAALKGYAGWSLYCAGKAGLESFFRALAEEERGQRCPFTAISVDPGVMDTDMQALIRSTPVEDFPALERFIRRKEAGELLPADRVADAIIKLLARSDLEGGARYRV